MYLKLQIAKFLGFTNTKISNNQITLSPFFFFFWGGGGGGFFPLFINLLTSPGGGDNLAGNCFVLRDLILIDFFKQVMIVKPKMCTTAQDFGKICV